MICISLLLIPAINRPNCIASAVMWRLTFDDLHMMQAAFQNNGDYTDLPGSLDPCGIRYFPFSSEKDTRFQFK